MSEQNTGKKIEFKDFIQNQTKKCEIIRQLRKLLSIQF